MTVWIAASFRASSRVASPDAAPVRIAVRYPPSMMATVAPVFSSCSRVVAMIVGNW